MTSLNTAPGFLKHPNHRVEIHPYDGLVNIEISSEIVQQVHGVLILKESGYEPVFYMAKSHFPSNFLEASEHSTHCPFKGDASYYHLSHRNKTYENAVWSYANPFDEAIAIKDYIAFYPNVAKVSPTQE